MTLSLPRMRGIVLALLFLSTVINYIDRQSLAVLLPLLRTDLHLTSVQYGSITTAFLAAYTLAQIPAGMLLDRIGTRAGFAIFVAVWSAAAVLQAFARTPLRFGAVRGLLGLSEAGNWPAGTKAVATWFPPQSRAKSMAFFDGGSAIGAVLAPPLVAAIAIHWDWRTAFVATGVLGFAWLALWLVAYQDPLTHPWLSSESRLLYAGTSADAQAPHSVRYSLRELARNRHLWGLMLVRLLATPIWWFYVFWLPDYLSKGRGFSLREIGLYAWIPYLTVDMGKFLGGYASDRMIDAGSSTMLARKSVMTVGSLFMLAGLLVANSSSTSLAMAWVCAATFGFGVWSANILALHADSFSPAMMGSAAGATGTAASLSGSVFTFVIGVVVARSGYAHVFWMTGVMAVSACAALWLTLRPFPDGEHGQTAVAMAEG